MKLPGIRLVPYLLGFGLGCLFLAGILVTSEIINALMEVL